MNTKTKTNKQSLPTTSSTNTNAFAHIVTMVNKRIPWLSICAGGYVATPLGQMYLIAQEQGLCGAWFATHPAGFKDIPPVLAQQIQQQDATLCSHPAIKAAVAWLQAYFASPQTANTNMPCSALSASAAPTLVLSLYGTAFQCAVWQELLKVPYGSTLSYALLTKAVAQRLHYADSYCGYRAVAQAVGHNPLVVFIPCHRIMGSQGQLTGFSSGLERKAWLLRHEGHEEHEEQVMLVKPSSN